MRSNWGVSAQAYGKQGPNNAVPFARLTKRGAVAHKDAMKLNSRINAVTICCGIIIISS
jgi:hypothetical protein